MASPRVADFLFDDENEDKLAAHGLTAQQVAQVLDNPHVLVPNRKGRRGLWLIIGTDDGGACIAVPIERTRERDVWRPITAWRCKQREASLLTRAEHVDKEQEEERPWLDDRPVP